MKKWELIANTTSRINEMSSEEFTKFLYDSGYDEECGWHKIEGIKMLYASEFEKEHRKSEIDPKVFRWMVAQIEKYERLLFGGDAE